MGFSVIYSAIPPSSNLYLRLQREKALNLFVSFIFSDSFGIFHFFEIDPEDIEETLENIIDVYPEIFKSKLDVDRIVAELQSELTLTCQTSPGIDYRTAMLEKSSSEIKRCLIQELSRKQIDNAEDFVQKLLVGDRTFAPNLVPPNEYDSSNLISRELVREGASFFRQIDPKTLFAQEDRYLQDLEELRDLYLGADENDEVILVGLS